MTPERPTAIVRAVDGLFAVVTRLDEPFVAPRAGGEELGSKAAVVRYVEVLVPLGQVAGKVGGLLPKLVRDWPSLEQVRAIEQVRPVVECVLDHTCPRDWIDDKVASPRPGEGLTDVARRTAANPRGYRGTKHKPPKSSAAPVVDLRPLLCSAKGLAELSTLLGISTPNVPFASRSLAAEVLRFLWPVRGATRSVQHTIVGLYASLRLDADPALRFALARFLTFAESSVVVEWCRLFESITPYRRVHLVALVNETLAVSRPLSQAWANTLLTVDALTSDDHFRYQAHCVLIAMLGEGSPGFVRDGIRLAHTYGPDHSLNAIDGPTGTYERILEFVPRIEEHSEFWPPWVLTLWERSAELPGLLDELSGIDWRDLGADHRWFLTVLVCDVARHDVDTDGVLAKWRVLRRLIRSIVDAVAAIPVEYRSKAIQLIEEIAWVFDLPVPLERNLGRLLRLLPTLCRPPSPRTGHGPVGLAPFLDLEGAAWEEVAAAVPNSFPRLESACRRSTDAGLIRWGLWALIERWPGFVPPGFRDQPARLCRLAKTLGSAPKPRRYVFIDELRKHPLFDPSLAQLPADELVATVHRYLADGMSSPIPRRLRQHSAGDLSLSEGQVERDRQQVVRQLLAFRLDFARHFVLVRQGESIGIRPTDRGERHAVLIQAAFDEQRRIARRVIKRYVSGERDVIEAHTSSQRWWKCHPKIERKVWRFGFDHRVEVPQEGPLVISIEQDLLEQLQLGTYVGSCLGLGGTHVFSAAAIALDVNKQVVYARNERGRVIARQVLAITDDDRLACFEIYPEKTSRAVKHAFSQFDREMARRLAVNIVDSDDSDPPITSILSHGWWCDHLWDLTVDEDEE